VNFLLHRAFAVREVGDPAAGFGAMLPDLVRLVDRRWRPRTTSPDAPPGPVRGILRGIEHHLEVDLWFHRAGELRAGERATVEALRVAGTTARRMPLFAHPIWEMLLDGAWVRRASASAVESALRDECEHLAAPAYEAMALHGAPEAGERSRWSVAEADLARLWSALPALATGYATAGGLALRIDGMRASLGLERAAPEEIGRWREALASLEPAADDALRTLEEARARVVSG